MKNNQKVLELHPHLSKLIDSLCFELAVNIPDQSSLSLLEILSMRRNNDITIDELKYLYKSWLESKHIFDIFSARQVKIYPKNQLISDVSLVQHLHISSINSSLELLHDLYDDLYVKKNGQVELMKIKEIQDLFSYLDSDGNIHLRLSQLFFLNISMLIHQNVQVPVTYEAFKPLFRLKNKDFCEIDGIVSLRWFKNYFLFKNASPNLANNIMKILKQIQRAIKFTEGKSKKGQSNDLPNILDQSFARWKNSARFSGLFQSKKKKIQIYHRIFDQNEEIFFFNGGKDDLTLSQNYFVKKYGQEYIKSLQIDNSLLKQFGQIVKQVTNEYLSVVSKLIQGQGLKNGKSHSNNLSGIYHTPVYQMNSSVQYNNSYAFNSSSFHNTSNKKNMNQSYQLNTKSNHHKSDIKSDIKSNKDKTPTKKTKGNETKRFNITPNNKNRKLSPFINKQFGSAEKSISKNKNSLTPTKSYTGGYLGTLQAGNVTQQIYRNSKKQGLQKDSFYQKLFFFRNKRVQSFDIVMKRLKGK